MKKATLLISVVVACLTQACSNDDIVSSSQSKAITFGSVFVNKPTRATEETTTDNLTKFGVNITATTTSGDETTNETTLVEVTKGNVLKNGVYNCEYSPKVEWDDAASYQFLAYAPYSATGITEKTANTLTFNNETAAGEQDVVAAYVPRDAGEQSPVNFTFDHLLSRVKFRIVNSYENTNYKINISSITLETVKSGTYDFVNKAWGNISEDSFEISYGSMSIDANQTATSGNYKESDYKYIISGKNKVVCKMKGTVINTKDSKTVKDIDYTKTVSDYDFKHGYSYYFKINCASGGDDKPNDQAIEFEIVESTHEYEPEFDFTGLSLIDLSSNTSVKSASSKQIYLVEYVDMPYKTSADGEATTSTGGKFEKLTYFNKASSGIYYVTVPRLSDFIIVGINKELVDKSFTSNWSSINRFWGASWPTDAETKYVSLENGYKLYYAEKDFTFNDYKISTGDNELTDVTLIFEYGVGISNLYVTRQVSSEYTTSQYHSTTSDDYDKDGGLDFDENGNIVLYDTSATDEQN